MKSGFCKGDYVKYILTKNCKRYNISIYRLVAKHFLNNYSIKLEVNHKDLKKSNNNFLNLEMVTRLENQRHYAKSKKDKI